MSAGQVPSAYGDARRGRDHLAAAIVGRYLKIHRHIALKDSRIAPLANRICSFPSCDIVRDERFSMRQRAPNDARVCDDDRCRWLTVHFTLLSWPRLHFKFAPVSSFVLATFCATP